MWPAIEQMSTWAGELGFSSLGVADIDLSSAEPQLQAWLDAGFHGELDYMTRHGTRRTRPAQLVPGTVSAVMVTMNYAPADPDWIGTAWATLADHERAYVSRYALGRDYHKVVRARLQQLASRIASASQPFGYRVFCDSGPVMEVELARKAGLGWRGKHTLLLDRQQGSMFFIGTLYTDLPLAASSGTSAGDQASQADHCGRCQRCIDVCPTQAIVAPYRLDARRCVSYLTIELAGSIPTELRPLLGNRIYGCDDCQLVCPWNKFAQTASVADFGVRNGLDAAGLIELFGWTPEQFDTRLQGSPIRRIGHPRWLRNLAVALGNALAACRSDADAAGATGVSAATDAAGVTAAVAVAEIADTTAAVGGAAAAVGGTTAGTTTAAALAAGTTGRAALIRAALLARRDDPSALVREHVEWALAAGRS